MAEKQPIGDLLDEIIEKKGAYSHDHLTHAENVMEKASKNASEIKQRLTEALKSLYSEAIKGSADIEMGIQALLEAVNLKEASA